MPHRSRSTSLAFATTSQVTDFLPGRTGTVLTFKHFLTVEADLEKTPSLEGLVVPGLFCSTTLLIVKGSTPDYLCQAGFISHAVDS